jgi:serine/threonine-protein kinase
MGAAHLALHAPSGERGPLLVVKRLHPELLREPTMLERFVHEAEVASHVRHPNVAQLVAMGSVGGEPFLSTEFVFGVQLSRLVDRIEQGATPAAPLGPALHLGWQLARGVRAIHEAAHRETGAPLGLLHRDVGARNVLLGYDGRARIIDLGLGKSVLADWQTSHEVLAGSPDYMPPEQAMGARVDARADVYALAVTLWELLAGRRRIREETVAKRVERCIAARPEPLRSVRPDVSPRLERLLMEGMDPDPGRRLPAAAQLEEGLRDELGRRSSAGEVAAWLDVACATMRARSSRELEADRARARAVVGQEGAATQIYVGDVGAYAERGGPPVDDAIFLVPEGPPRSVRGAEGRTPAPGEGGRGEGGVLPLSGPALRARGGAWAALRAGAGRTPAPGEGDRREGGVLPLRGPALRAWGAALRALGDRRAASRSGGLGAATRPRPALAAAARAALGAGAFAREALAPLAALPPTTRWVMSGVLLAAALGAAALTAALTAPPAPVRLVTHPPSPPAAPRRAAPEPAEPAEPADEPAVAAAAPEPAVPPPKPARERVEKPRSAGRRPADEARRRRLVKRIRELRSRSFEIGFQRAVTRLSARISRARTRAALDALERRIERLEDRS